MKMLTSKRVKEFAKEKGADLVGITSMDRFEGLPLQMDPRQIFPEAKSMIVLGFRLFRGNYRGIEEGTYFSAYNIMGFEGIRWVFAPTVMWDFTKILEDEGYEALPVPNNFPWSNIDNIDPDTVGLDFMHVNVKKYGKTDGNWSRPVAEGRAAPDVFFQLKIAAFLAGLGEVGYSGEFLTPEYGPRQMFSAVITDAPLEPDPVFTGSLCDKCMKCVKVCPAKAISAKETVKVTVGGHEIEWAKIDFEKCALSFHGGSKKYNPFITSEEDYKEFNRSPYTEAMHYKLSPFFEYGRGVEGQRGCHIECMIHLEEHGKIRNKFKNRFRRKKAWEINWNLKPEENVESGNDPKDMDHY